MRNWTSMASCPERELNELQLELERARHLIFDDVLMPEDCGRCVCQVSFLLHDSGSITLRVSPNPAYTGENEQIRSWCERGSLVLRDFRALTTFLRLFAGPAPDRQPTRVAGPMPVTGIPQRPVLRVDRTRLDENSEAARTLPAYILISPEALEEELHKSIIGQESAVRKVAFLTSLHLGQRHPLSPLSILLWGSTGTGKTQLGKQLPAALNTLTGGQYDFHLEIVDCTQMKEEHDTARLTGSPPGYIGHGEGCVWDAVLEHPRTVFLFNELEKAHPRVMQVLMEAVDSGRQEASHVLDDGSRSYDLSRCLFLFTSNLSLETTRRTGSIGFSAQPAPLPVQLPEPRPGDPVAALLRETARDREALNALGIYPREVVARFTAFVKYEAFTNSEILELVIHKVSEAAYRQHELCLVRCGEQIIQALYDLAVPEVRAAGVRPLERLISAYLGGPLSRFSHGREPYARCALSGTLEAPVVEEEPEEACCG